MDLKVEVRGGEAVAVLIHQGSAAERARAIHSAVM
jgi:hypothetical protein